MSDFLLNVARRAAGVAPVAASIKPAAAPALDAWAGPEALEEGVEETPAPLPPAEPAGETVPPSPPQRVAETPVRGSAEAVPVVPRPNTAAEPAGLERSVRVEHVHVETPRAVEGAATGAVAGGAGVSPAVRPAVRAGGRDARAPRGAPVTVEPAEPERVVVPRPESPAPVGASRAAGSEPIVAARAAPDGSARKAQSSAPTPAPSAATLRPRVAAEQPLPRQQAMERAAAPPPPRIEVRIGRIDVEIAARPAATPAAPAPVRERPRGFDAYARLRAYGER
jgi:hypothetical protein